MITTRHGRTLVEPGALARRLGGRAQVVLVETGEATYALRDALGDELAVWGGAARVYHPGFTLDGSRLAASAHLRLRGARERGRARAAGRARHRGCAQTEEHFAVGDDVEGEVVSLDARTATLALPDGCGRVRAGDLARGFVHSCHDVLRIGQRVRARVRELAPDGTPWLDLQPFQADEIATIAEQAGPGDVVRVRVRRRSNNGYQVELLPGADAFVPLAHCPPELEAERDDVLAARIVRLDVAERRIVVSLADAPASAEGARPLRLYADGPVFLASDGVAAQRAASELDRSEGELSDVRERLEQALAEADAARAERDRLAEELRDERGRARALAAEPAQHARGRDRSRRDPALEALCDEGAFLAWLGVTHARLHGPAERTRYPLRRVVVGPQFLGSLRELQGVSLHRVLDACVHVATGRAAEIPGLELHPLRAGAGGTEQRQRPDGARAWRCALQVHSPSARRLHFWRLEATGSSSTASAPTTRTSRRAAALSRRRRAARGPVRGRPARRRACARARAPRRRGSGRALLASASRCSTSATRSSCLRSATVSGLTGGCGGCCGALECELEPPPRSRRPAGAPPSRRRGGRAARSCVEHLIARGAEGLPELLVVGAAGAAGRLPLVHLTRQRRLGGGRVERLDERLGLLDQRALGGARAAALRDRARRPSSGGGRRPRGGWPRSAPRAPAPDRARRARRPSTRSSGARAHRRWRGRRRRSRAPRISAISASLRSTVAVRSRARSA